MTLSLGESLKQWREFRHYSRVEVAELSGVGYNTLYRVEAGRHNSMLWKDLLKVAGVLGITTIKQLQEGPKHGVVTQAEIC